jgi:ribosome-associated protein
VQEEDKPSKTQRKRAMHELQALGERLVELNAAQLAEMALPESLSEAIEEVRRMTKHEARRRQLQYIGRLMRTADADSIRERLRAWEGVSVRHTAHLHRLERWREELLGDDSALGALASAHPGVDTQYLRVLVRNARAERGSGRAPRAYRELFRALRDIIPESQALPGHEHE